MLDERKAILEFLLCIKSAGAEVILTYFASQAARYLCGEEWMYLNEDVLHSITLSRPVIGLS